MKSNIKITAVSAILTALCTALIIVGSLLDILDLTVSAFCSFIIAAAVFEFKCTKYPILIYACTSVLSFIFMPMSSAALYFAVFFGYYPILRKKIVILRKPFSKIVSFALFYASMSVLLFLMTRFFGLSKEPLGIYLLLFVMGTVFFVCYDLILEKFDIIYKYKLRKIFKH